MNGDTNKLKAIQGILGLEQDGMWGPQSRAALQALISPPNPPRAVYGSSFADPVDVARFRMCKMKGKSDEECFKVGDNGIGAWGDDTTQGSGPSCALPPEHIIEKWGSVDAGHLKPVLIKRETDDGTELKVIALLKDRMPHLANMTTRARIDMNFDTCKALDLSVPAMNPVVWQWG